MSLHCHQSPDPFQGMAAIFGYTGHARDNSWEARQGSETTCTVPQRESFLRTCSIHCSVVVVLLAVHLTSLMDKGRGKDPSGRGLLR